MADSNRILAAARAAVGLCGCPAHRSAFAAFLGPVVGQWDLARVYGQDTFGTGKGTLSTCAVVFRAACRLGGVKQPPGFYPYKSGAFVEDHAWPERLGAAVSGICNPKALVSTAPSEGDGIWTGSHFMLLDQWENPPDVTSPYCDLWSIDGGRLCLRNGNGHLGVGLQSVERVHRRWWFGPVPRVQELDTKAVAPKNQVLGWVRVGLLPT